MMEQNVVIAVDHTTLAETAVKFYLNRIHRPGNRVVLVHCIELPEVTTVKAKESHVSPAVLTNMWKNEEARTKVLEDKMKELLATKQVPAVLRTATGRPGETICAIADEEHAVMIITGRRSIGKVQRTFLGSVSDYLVGHAPCPFIIVRDLAEAERKRRPSGDQSNKSRHTSGDSFTAHLRQRFASGGKRNSQAGGGPSESGVGSFGGGGASMGGAGLSEESGSGKKPIESGSGKKSIERKNLLSSSSGGEEDAVSPTGITMSQMKPITMAT